MGLFYIFLSCTNGTKSRKTSQLCKGIFYVNISKIQFLLYQKSTYVKFLRFVRFLTIPIALDYI